MGICFGWLSKGNLLSHPNPPPIDREEIYKDLKTYFHESHEKADQLQQNFANKVIQSTQIIDQARKKAVEELRKSKKTKQLKEEEAEKIVRNLQKENEWLNKSHNTIADVLAKLTKVHQHEPHFMGEQPNHTNYDTLMSKLRTDVMTLIDLRMKQITTLPRCTSLDAPNIDNETDEPSEKDYKDSGISSEHVSENESNFDVESNDKCDIHERQDRPDRHKRQIQDFILLYECTLILKTVLEDFSKVYLLIKGTHSST